MSNKTVKKFKVFYRSQNKVISLGEDSDEIFTEPDNNKDIKHYNYFELFDKYTPDTAGLFKFRDDFSVWVKELQDKYNIIYTKYFNHLKTVYYTFLRYSAQSSILKDYQNENDYFENITIKEFLYFERCNNGGLISLNQNFRNVEVKCFGKDFKSYYPSLLAREEYKLQMPTKAGYESKITDFKRKLKYGIYKIKISCDSPEFKQIFSFSKDNHYTHYSVNFCLKQKKRFDIKFEILDTDKEFNCLVYDDKDLVYTHKIFGGWFKKLFEIKQECPNNRLIKHLLSSIWGVVSQFDREILRTDEEYDECDLSFLDDDDETEYKLLDIYKFVEDGELKMHYEIVKSEHPYKHNLTRVKPFMTSLSRRHVAELLINKEIPLNDVVRIYCDGIVLTKDYEFSGDLEPVSDEKYNGLLKWNNASECLKFVNGEWTKITK